MSKDDTSWIFWATVITVAAVYIFLKSVFPYLAMAIADKPNPLPMPSMALLMYMFLTILGAVVYISFDDRRLRRFLRPLLVLLIGRGAKGLRAGRTVFLIALPLLMAVSMFRVLVPSAEPPLGLRIQHPTMPGKYEREVNPFRNPGSELIKQFLENSPGNMSKEEARAALVANYIEEGTILYQKNCRPCHGTKADGTGPMARGFRLRPANFTDPGTIATVVEAYALWRVREGGIGLPNDASPWDSSMPRWMEDLSDLDIWKIILAEYHIAGMEPRLPEKHEERE